MTIVSTIVAFLIFTVIVTIHEFGHFLFARKAGIFVEEFAIGMGPKIFSKKFSETEFSIRALPIGGFCKMYGEDERIEGDDRAYGSKSVLQRFMVILGGPLFNFVLAMIVGIIFFATLGGTMTTRVDDFADQSPAREAGIMVGDVITSYNDRAVYTFNELVIYINTDIEETAEVEVKREGEGRRLFMLNLTRMIVVGIIWALCQGTKSLRMSFRCLTLRLEKSSITLESSSTHLAIWLQMVFKAMKCLDQ